MSAEELNLLCFSFNCFCLELFIPSENCPSTSSARSTSHGYYYSAADTLRGTLRVVEKVVTPTAWFAADSSRPPATMMMKSSLKAPYRGSASRV
jgi:hypothetical protein